MIFKKSLLFLIALVIAISSIYAQIPGDRSKYYNYGARFYSELHFFPADNPDSVKAVLMFRISYSTLNFIKPTEISENKEAFIAIPYVEAEIKDSEGIIRNLAEWRDTIVTDDYDATKARDVFVFGYKEISLANDTYSVEIRLYDHNQTVTKEIELSEIKELQFLKKELIAPPILTQRSEDNGEMSFFPYIFQNRIPFSGKNNVLLLQVSYKDEFPKYDFTISLESQDIKGLIWKNPTTLSGRTIPDENKCIQLSDKASMDGLDLLLKNCNHAGSGYKIGVLRIPLPQENLVPGNYDLKIVKAGSKDTLSHTFKVKWMDMPLSLYNYEYAAEMMYYILTEDQLEEMKDGSIEEIRLKVWKYWTDHDPTPNTLYNEAMQQYFNRVDYAYYNYKSFSQKDGAKSARGKIYILKGAPDSVKRNINDGVVTEKWFYPNLKKEFVFTTENNANYDLKEINDIE